MRFRCLNDAVSRRKLAFTLVAGCFLACLTPKSVLAQTTVSFQQGVDGYNGTLDVFIGPDGSGIDAFGNILGTDVEEQFLDGRYFDISGNNQDKQLLLRFDDIFGMDAGQIPLGAKIESATLALTTGEGSGNARSGGPYAVAQMIVPFDELTSWFDLGDFGATFAGGQTDRPLDKGFGGPMEGSTYGANQQGSPQHADLTRVVQNWADGAENHGITVQAGTTDGWQVFTTSVRVPELRPRLEVTYSDPSTTPVTTVTLQEGVNGYAGTIMARLNENDITEDGSLLLEEFLDGPTLTGTSADNQALIKFEGIFASEGGEVPDDAVITESYLVLDTASAARSENVGTNGSFAVHQMLTDWDLSSVYSQFGENGPDPGNGTVAPATDWTGAMIADARTWLEVTEAVQAWQAGEPNFGLNVQAATTYDGWAIQWLGSDNPPQLVIHYSEGTAQGLAVPEPATWCLLLFAAAFAAATRFPRRIAAVLLLTCCLGVATAAAQTNVSFQQGLNGYAGTLDVFIGPDGSEIPDGAFGNQLGADIEEQFLDGIYFDVTGTNDDKQLLLRFDDIFGGAAGQIPAGATIESAQLTLITGEGSGSARSGGPYGVAQMLVPFDETSTWFSLGDFGVTFESGQTYRPLDNGFAGPMEASLFDVGGIASEQQADITPIVQNWADGDDNHGVTVRAGTTDGWQIFTTGVRVPELRPRLDVTYSTDPRPEVTTVTLQENVEGYAGTTMARLNQNDVTEDGTLLFDDFLDGPTLTGTSPDNQMLIKFDGIFTSEGGQVPDDAFITESYLVLDTATAAKGNAVGTNGNYAVHQMLVDWSFDSVYSDFGDLGPDLGDGEVAPASDRTGSLIADARAMLEVTDAVRAWQAGAENFGLNVQSEDTADGWAIHWLGSDNPPQLIVNYTDQPPMGIAGDYNGNGQVEQGDLDLVLLNWGEEIDPTSVSWENDLPTGPIDQGELDGVLLNWGNAAASLAGAPVPEPATWWLLVLAGAVGCIGMPRRAAKR